MFRRVIRVVLYLDALDKAGEADKAHERAEAYLNKFGKKGKYYKQVVATISRIDLKKDEDKKQRDQAFALANVNYPVALAKHSKDIGECEADDASNRQAVKENMERLQRQCQNYGKYGCGNYRDERAEDLWKRMQKAIGKDSNWSSRNCRADFPMPVKPAY